MGQRFLVRRLPAADADGVRLVAATLGYALGHVFRRMRIDGMTDHKKLIKDVLEAAKRGEILEYIIQGPNGFLLKVDDADDHARAMEALPVILQSMAPASAAAPSPIAAVKPAEKAAPMLHASIELFLTQFAEKNPAAATLLETRHSLHLFRDLTRDKPVAQVGVDECDAFRAALSHWPARARVLPGFKGMSARAIVQKAKTLKLAGIEIRTKEKHLDRLRVYFNWCVQRRWMANNPLTGVRLQTKGQKYAPKRRAFSKDELQQLFAPELRRAHCLSDPSKFWIPLLALYTGARLRELAQLRCVDVRPVVGIWGVDIVPEVGPLKNSGSQRFVPLPDVLLNAGLLEYLEDLKQKGFDRLFPDGSWDAKNGPGDRMSKWWARTFMPAAGLHDDALVFHSFRHTLASAGDELGFTEAQIGALTGHQGTSVLRKHYINVGDLDGKGHAGRVAGWGDRQLRTRRFRVRFSYSFSAYQRGWRHLCSDSCGLRGGRAARQRASTSRTASSIGARLAHLGCVSGCVLHACLPGLLTAMGAANHLAQLARYFSIWLWTVPLMFVSANTFAIIRNLGYFKTASAITLVATAVGAYLSILLIPVHMGGAIWGVAGSAYSTLATSALSTMLSLAFVVVLSCKGGESAFWSAFVEMAQNILIIGLPVLLSNILLFLFLSMLTRVFSGFGQDSIAAYGINGRVEQILLYFQTAFVTVATPTITRLWTKHDSASMLVFIRGMASLMFWFSLVGAAIVFVARHWIAAMASPTPETYKICVFFLCVVPGTIGLQGIFILATTALNLMKKPGRSLLWCGVYYGVINAPLLLASQSLGDARWSISALALATIVAGALSWLLISREIKAATGVMDHLIMPMSNESAKL